MIIRHPSLEPLELQVATLLPKALARISSIRGREVSVSSFHGQIGGKNARYTDCIHTQFSDPKDFIAQWLHGLNNNAEEYANKGWDNASTRLVVLLQDDLLREYTFLFLERNFYRQFLERTRCKPDQDMWSIWFGAGKHVWGLLLAPTLRSGEWTNDVSEIRRARYSYWTVGHVLQTGIIDPARDKPHFFSDVQALLDFYQSFLKRDSNSVYEEQIFDLYCNYLATSSSVEEEPLLIPELRHGGQKKKHEYRLDFTVLNSHTMNTTGFEISPASSHMSVSGIKGKRQYEVNDDLKIKWDREMAKRNAYFLGYGIPVVTFTDERLRDIDACFNEIRAHLAMRDTKKAILEAELSRLIRR